MIVSELGLKGARPVTTPGSRDDVAKQAEENGDDGQGNTCGIKMGSADASKYRAITARLNYLAQDRPELLYAAKECSRRMSAPEEGDWIILKRVGRYLVHSPRVVQMFRWQEMPTKIDTHVDSDWAGCRRTCRSTSGGAMSLGMHMIKAWASTQATLALSSGEAELFALVKGSAASLGLISLAYDLGYTFGAPP